MRDVHHLGIGTTKVATPAIDAATVALVRDGADGIETLMLRKNSKVAFGGMWVFPGGRVDDEDRAAPLGDDELGAHRAAAIREAEEEADVVLPRDPEGIVPLSFWMPPPIEVKRFATWFFVARNPSGPAGDVMIDDGEIHESQWARPADLIARRDAGEVQLVPPTWVTLHEFASHETVDALLAHVAAEESPQFITRADLRGEILVTLWPGDAGYETSDARIEGARNRLTLSDAAWTYERTI